MTVPLLAKDLNAAAIAADADLAGAISGSLKAFAGAITSQRFADV